MGACTSASVRIPHEKQFRRAIKLYEVAEVKTLTNLLNRNKCFETGESPLTLAAREGHEAVVAELIRCGADVNKLDHNGYGALHIAVQINDEETVDILLNNGANPNKYDGNNLTPLHIACRRGFHQILEKLLSADADANENRRSIPPLINAVANSHGECVELLLKHHADPNVTDARGSTALQIAVANSDVLSIRALLAHDADIYSLNRDKETLISLAAMNGCQGAVQALVDAQCDVNQHQLEEPPAIVAATARGSSECIDILISARVDVDILDKKSQSALQIAVMSVVDYQREVFYCKYFSNVYRLYSKYDPLEIFQENSTKCAMALLQGGADVSRVWDKFSQLFPSPNGITFEQMVLCEVLIQAYGFKNISQNKIKTFVTNLLSLKEFGLVRLLYSTGIDPTWDDVGLVGLSGTNTEEANKEMYQWMKHLKTNPRELKDICRRHIRGAISWNVIYLIEKLPVTAIAREYVCIIDTDHYSFPYSV